MTSKLIAPGELTAGTYAALVDPDSESIGHELNELLAEADARVVPCLTKSPEECRLEALVAVVREKTREEDLKAFRTVLRRYRRTCDLAASMDIGSLASIVSKTVLEIRRLQRRQTAAKGGLAQRPSMREVKKQVKALWLERRAGKHPKLRTNEQFAMECMRRWENDLKNIKTILGWCTRWKNELKEIPAS